MLNIPTPAAPTSPGTGTSTRRPAVDGDRTRDFERALQSRRAANGHADEDDPAPADLAASIDGAPRFAQAPYHRSETRDAEPDAAVPTLSATDAAGRPVRANDASRDAPLTSALAPSSRSATAVVQARSLEPGSMPSPPVPGAGAETGRWQVDLPASAGGLQLAVQRTAAVTVGPAAAATWSLQFAGATAATLAAHAPQLVQRLRDRAMDVAAARFTSHARVDGPQQEEHGDRRQR